MIGEMPLAHQPGEHDDAGGDPEPSGHAREGRQPGRRAGVEVGVGERAVLPVEGALDERAVGPDLDLGVLLDVVARLLGDPAEAVVLALDGRTGPGFDVGRRELERGDGLEPPGRGVRAGALDHPRRVVGQPESRGTPVGDQRTHRLGGLLDGSRQVARVGPEEVDPLDPEPGQARLGPAAYDLCRQALGVPAVVGLHAHLGGDLHPLPHAGVGAQPVAEHALALAAVT